MRARLLVLLGFTVAAAGCHLALDPDGLEWPWPDAGVTLADGSLGLDAAELDGGPGDASEPVPGPDAEEPGPDADVDPGPDADVEPGPDADVEPGPDAAAEPGPDAASLEPDASAPEPDASAPEPDASAPEPDASAPEPDAGAPEPDAGAEEPGCASFGYQNTTGSETVYGALNASRFTLSAQRMVNSLWVLVQNTGSQGGQLNAAIYEHDSGMGPGNLIEYAGWVDPVNGWNQLFIPATLLEPGDYWLAILAGPDVEVGYKSTGPHPQYEAWSEWEYEYFPDPFNPVHTSDGVFGIYAECDP